MRFVRQRRDRRHKTFVTKKVDRKPVRERFCQHHAEQRMLLTPNMDIRGNIHIMLKCLICKRHVATIQQANLPIEMQEAMNKNNPVTLTRPLTA